MKRPGWPGGARGHAPRVRSGGRRVRAAIALLALAGAALPAAAVGEPALETDDPRAFGYQVGDRLQRRITLHLPEGWQLDDDTLPAPGQRGRALELQSVVRRDDRDAGGRRITLALDYQVLLAPAAVRVVEIAPLRIGVRTAGRAQDLRVEAWPVAIAPLLPAQAPTRRGLGELQPDRAPAAVDTAPRQRRLAALAAAALLPGGWLAWLYAGPPWRAARRRPFGVAWRQLRGLPADPPPARWRTACRQFHEALDRCAGQVLFEHDLPAFVAAQPGFAPLRDDLRRFLQDSRAEFFGAGGRRGGDGAWLANLCRRCHDVERGLA